VTGCADPQLPRLTWMSRRQDTLTVFCNQTSERWHLVCKSNTWVGSYGNCTQGRLRAWMLQNTYYYNKKLCCRREAARCFVSVSSSLQQYNTSSAVFYY